MSEATPKQRVSDEQVARDRELVRRNRITADRAFYMSAGYPGDLADARAQVDDLTRQLADAHDGLKLWQDRAMVELGDADVAIARADKAEAALRDVTRQLEERTAERDRAHLRWGRDMLHLNDLAPDLAQEIECAGGKGPSISPIPDNTPPQDAPCDRGTITREAVAAEREACAKVVENFYCGFCGKRGVGAAAIRARNEGDRG